MAGTLLRSALRGQRSRPILSAPCAARKSVTDQHVFLLHCEEAAQVVLGEIELFQARQHHRGGGA
jgi:hypothetical protein